MQVTGRPADQIEPELEKVREQMAEYMEQDEDILTWAMFPKVAEAFFKERRLRLHGIDNVAGDIDEAYQPV